MGLILIAAVILSGAAGGYSYARVVTTVRDGRAIDRRDGGAAIVFGALLIAAALLLSFVEGR